MPRIGMEPVRRKALLEAAIEAIHARGSLEVTVSEIARRAGVSSALAHHYFGGKDDLIVATMRHLIGLFSSHVRERLKLARGPGERLSAIIEASFTPDQLQPSVMSAWLVFYALAQASPEAARLHRIYVRRLDSNLRRELKALAGSPERARRIAFSTAALIDGLYLRLALGSDPGAGEEARALVEDHLQRQIGGSGDHGHA
jgi:TetR/AcrR family transcriptional repressor of bet genes